ncbi:MAG: coproporphyrinogen III oxidase, partial [Lachnospiraceae bacterium]|nr:coproporphyrinogen III oxidase [Lachnospiraceae bacterium]
MQLYVHIPFCLRKCNYCDFLSYPADESAREAYVGALSREIARRAQMMGRGEKLTSIYLGGGTPSMLTVRQLETIVNT